MALFQQIAEKRKKLKKDGKGDDPIPEDDPAKYKHAIYVMVMKVGNGKCITMQFSSIHNFNNIFGSVSQLFADMERRRQQLETRDMEERKRKREAEIDEEEHRAADKEWQKNFEESRQNRVDSWHTFQSGSGSSKKKAKKQKKQQPFSMPKLKPETR